MSVQENSGLKEELNVALEQVDTLTRVMEKLKLELDANINNSLELEESKIKVEELKKQVITLGKHKQELEGILSIKYRKRITFKEANRAV
jgi:hypothetical protein